MVSIAVFVGLLSTIAAQDTPAGSAATPHFPSFEPVELSGDHAGNAPAPRYTDSRMEGLSSTPASPHNAVPSSQPGLTADDIIRQQNAQAMLAMGYQPPVVPPTDPVALHRFILQQHNRASYATREYGELLSILNEAGAAENGKRFRPEYYKSPEFAAATKPFTDAFGSVKDMLDGRKPLSVRAAFYEAERAYGSTYLSRQEYDRIIKESAGFIRIWLAQNGYDPTNNEHLHMGIQKFMSDTLTILIPAADGKQQQRTKTHYPFGYDYDDFKGERDHRNYFMTKTLATGYGQCDGLPDVYIAIAEELGATVYMSFAPQHSFVKYPDNNGRIHNYEPTSHWNISDKWYKDYMFISTRATVTGIYLDTLNRQMMAANSLLDLAFAYLVKHGAADGAFINACVSEAMKHFPRGNNIQALFLRSSVMARHLDRILQANGITDLKDIEKIPEAKKLYERLRQNEELIKSLGYQETPESMYEQLMEEHQFKGRRQQADNISGKQKRNLFSINTH